MALKKAIKQKTISILRSGKYAKCKGQLAEVDGSGKVVAICALGAVALAADPAMNTWSPTDVDFGMTDKQMKLIGRHGKVNETRLSRLMKLNDESNWSHKAIANHVERTPSL